MVQKHYFNLKYLFEKYKIKLLKKRNDFIECSLKCSVNGSIFCLNGITKHQYLQGFNCSCILHDYLANLNCSSFVELFDDCKGGTS